MFAIPYLGPQLSHAKTSACSAQILPWKGSRCAVSIHAHACRASSCKIDLDRPCNERPSSRVLTTSCHHPSIRPPRKALRSSCALHLFFQLTNGCLILDPCHDTNLDPKSEPEPTVSPEDSMADVSGKLALVSHGCVAKGCHGCPIGCDSCQSPRHHPRCFIFPDRCQCLVFLASRP